MPNPEEHTGSEAAPAQVEASHTQPPHGEISSPVQQPTHPFPSDLEVSSSVGVSHHPNEGSITYLSFLRTASRPILPLDRLWRETRLAILLSQC